MGKLRIVNVAGARPNFMKIAPLMEAFRRDGRVQPLLVHTGQHYDERMSDLFFRQLGLPQPDVNLEVGSGPHGAQTARIMLAFEPLAVQWKPDAVLVVGDVNSTVACGLVAVKLGIPLVHVEAGLRSGDRSMPEEINRIVTDSISDLLFCTEQSGVDHLRREGVPADRTFLVGNVMIDCLLKHLSRAQASPILDELGLKPKGYALLTLHRPGNVDNPAVLDGILGAVETIARDLPVLFPVHPRTRARLASRAGAAVDAASGRVGKRSEAASTGVAGLRLVEPMGYLEFLRAMSQAKVVLTDSGGIQEETTILKVPCLTLRESTERPITAEVGSNRIVGTNPGRILSAYREAVGGAARASAVPPLWDGRAAERIVDILCKRLGRGG
jgi:UDP-N-acetylglucosamine 2-epimerase (non-hydrolysing)